MGNEYNKLIDTELQEMTKNSALRDRRIFINDEIDRNVTFKTSYYLQRLRDIDNNNKIPMKDRKPITLIINTYGGFVYEGCGLVSLMEEMVEDGYKIITICDSFAMSFGFTILVCGSERYMRRYATAMCHQVSSGTQGTIAQQKKQLAESIRLNDMMMKIIMKHTNMTREEIENMINNSEDMYMDAETCLTKGIVDKIL